MQKNHIFDLMTAADEKNQLTTILSSNDRSGTFGLTLTESDAKELLCCKKESLQKYHRIEFGNGIVDQLVDHFCDSPYIDQDNYLVTLETLQDIFYDAKNETHDQVTDEELLNFMEEQFNTVCFGDTDYLASMCMEKFIYSIARGNQSFHETDGKDAYEQIADDAYHDKTLYYESLKDQF